MRKSLFIIFLFLSLISCRQHLVVSEIKTKNISNSPSKFSPDSSIVFLVQPYKEALEEDMSEVISISGEEMFKQKPESKLTNYLSDLLLEEGKAFCKSYNYNFAPDVAYLNYGGIRSSLPKGEITVGDVYELMPFENEMVILELSGKDLKTFAGQIASVGGDAISGLTIGIKNKELTTVEMNGQELVDEKSYFVVTNDYVANGGDDMNVFKNRKRHIPTGFKLRDIIIRNMKKDYGAGLKIDAQKDGRIYYE